jgi:hypothetical protein
MTTAPTAAAAGFAAGVASPACADAPPPIAGAGPLVAAPSPIQTDASALPGAPALGASLIGGGGATAAPALASTPGAPVGMADPLDPAQLSAVVATLAQLALAATSALGASAAGGAGVLPDAAAPVSLPPATLPTAPAAPTTTAPVGADAAPAPAAATAAPAAARPLTSIAPGGNAQDAALVERALEFLRRSPSGAQAVDRMLAVGARINVISDEEFAAMGQASAHAFYDPKLDSMFIRRSDLADDGNLAFAAVALAHEGTHLLDDVSGIGEPIIQEITAKVAAAGGLETAAGIEAREQGLFELMMIKETRAFTFAGAVARELGLQLPATDPTSTAIAGANDQATYLAVWQRLLQSGYNDQNRTAQPRNL